MTNKVFIKQARENIPALARRADLHVSCGRGRVYSVFSSADRCQRILFQKSADPLFIQQFLTNYIHERGL